MRTVIKNAALYDGSGNPPQVGDLAILDDRISSVGAVEDSGGPEIDGSGLAVAPGFIDVHTHDDFAALVHPDMAFKSLGGVTTCIVGNCGFGAAPRHVAAATATMFHPHDELPHYDGYAGYLGRLDQHPPGVNIGALAGHGTIRLAAMGLADRDPDEAEMTAMANMVDEAIESGVLGLSTGLIYEPGRYAGTREIIELASRMRGTSGLYATHMRDEAGGLLTSVRETLEIGRAAGVPVQISHHKATGRANWGLVGQSLELIDEARAGGQVVHADQYPYTAGSTALAAVVQNKMFADDDSAEMTADDVVIAACEVTAWEGLALGELARSFGCPPTVAAERVLAESPSTSVVLHSMSEDDVQTVLRHRSTMIGSDGLPTLHGKPHPRLYNSFARVLGHYSRDLSVLPMDEAIHKMTGYAAETFGLTDRGYLRPGSFADVVVFDPSTIIDRGTFADPNQYPSGIHHVFVNGVPVVDATGSTKARPGRVLRRRD